MFARSCADSRISATAGGKDPLPARAVIQAMFASRDALPRRTPDIKVCTSGFGLEPVIGIQVVFSLAKARRRLAAVLWNMRTRVPTRDAGRWKDGPCRFEPV